MYEEAPGFRPGPRGGAMGRARSNLRASKCARLYIMKPVAAETKWRKIDTVRDNRRIITDRGVKHDYFVHSQFLTVQRLPSLPAVLVLDLDVGAQVEIESKV